MNRTLSSLIVELRSSGWRLPSSSSNRDRKRVPAWNSPCSLPSAGQDVAVRIEHREAVAVLQDARGVGRPLGLAENRELLVEREDVRLHRASPRRPAVERRSAIAARR